MNPTQFETRMRQGEIFHALRAPPRCWLVVRVDGRSFSKFTAERYEKPFDERFHQSMVAAARTLVEELGALYGYTESDEISLLLTPAWDLFDREVEKIVSISAGVASSSFTLASGHAAHFDARIWVGGSEGDAVDYFRWRQSDATRCALNGWCYWVLRKAGKSVGDATTALSGLGVAEKNELLFQHGINFNTVPLWQRRGTGLYLEEYEKEGLNPLTKERTAVKRRRIRVDEELRMKEEYSAFLLKLMEPHRPGPASAEETDGQ